MMLQHGGTCKHHANKARQYLGTDLSGRRIEKVERFPFLHAIDI